MSLAARFAAKEAFGKALGTGFEGIVLKDILLRSGPCGQPEIKVFGTALAAFKKSKAGRIHVSLSHEKDIAAAVLILEHGGSV
jgi:holo-[acyl-carrier protein] synthase